ncbi:MAG: SDR family NAD(P)-dependent oxidoreductase, partial [Pseudomonadales bacterium]|nr:SDR family NAD(P)-dependent oxidoreductase [Pseudomonadales bacterium]
EWGHIVNVSSLFGLIGIPNQSAYNSAKFAVRGFSESLRMEMELEGANVGVSCIHPGGVNTNIVNNARFGTQIGKARSVAQQKKIFTEKLAKTSPESAARDIINGIKNDSPRVLVGNDAKLLDAVQRVLPTYYQKLVLKMLGEK